MKATTPPNADTILIYVVENDGDKVFAWAKVAEGTSVKIGIPKEQFGEIYPSIYKDFWYNLKTKKISDLDWDSDPEYKRIKASLDQLEEEFEKEFSEKSAELDDTDE